MSGGIGPEEPSVIAAKAAISSGSIGTGPGPSAGSGGGCTIPISSGPMPTGGIGGIASGGIGGIASGGIGGCGGSGGGGAPPDSIASGVMNFCTSRSPKPSANNFI